MQRGVWGLLVAAGVLSGCGSDGSPDEATTSRALPSARSASARAMRLPVLRLAPTLAVQDGAPGRVVQVRVQIEGQVAGDSVIPVGTLDPSCGAGRTDTLVTRSGAAVVGAMVWVEGKTTVHAPVGTPERRATVTLTNCQLSPRIQVAPPRSTLQLVMRDTRAESLVVVPSVAAVPIDTVAFLTDGQLVPLRQRADSIGMIAIHALHLPWARAYIAITPPAVSAISDVDGVARFTLDRTGRSAIFRAWHPALGIVSATVDPTTLGDSGTVTLSFKR